MNKLNPLWLNLVLTHLRQDLRQPERSVDHIKSALILQKTHTLPQNIIQCTQDFMPCDRLSVIWIPESMLCQHIRWIRRDHIKKSRFENCCGLLYISGHNLHSVLQVIITDTSLCHLSRICLNLQSGKMLSLCLSSQKNRDNSIPCSHIKYRFSLTHLCKV